MKKIATCSYCGSTNHNSLRCFKKHIATLRDRPKKTKKIRKESERSVQKRQILKTSFFNLNPPDERGGYTCYLQISPMCPKWLPKYAITAEHVYPKNSGKYPELKYVPENILGACAFCNSAKLSNTPEQLAIFYPTARTWLKSPEHDQFMERLKEAIKKRNINLYWNEELRKFVRYEPDRV